MSELTTCKTCRKDVSKTAPTCPNCGESSPGLHIKCPKCDSMNISTGEKGFGLKGAAIGAILLGPVGLLGGMIGRKKTELFCQSCNHKWLFDPKMLS